MTTDYLTRKEAARYLSERGYRIEHKTLANMAANGNQGKGPAFTRFGWKAVRYTKLELDRWLKAQKTEVAA